MRASVIARKNPGDESRRAGAEAFGSLRNADGLLQFADFTQV